MKKVIYLFVGILALFFVASCDNSEDSVIVDPAAELVEVSFDVDNFFPDIAAKGTPKDGVPECNENGVPTTAVVILDGVTYTLNILAVNDGMETEVMKLEAKTYALESFVIFGAEGELLHATTNAGSDYALAWPNLTSLPMDLDVVEFTKKKFKVDVLCYQPYDYENFGFAWFEYAKHEVKTVCFFGDICSKFWESWRDAEGSPYANSITGYDFRAGFKVLLTDATGNPLNTVDGTNYAPDGMMDADGKVIPLCIEYPHMVGSTEVITFEIQLLQPDGSYVSVYTSTFASGDMADLTEDGFGGTDGVFDFIIGNCYNEDVDVSLELPAYIPIPKTVNFKYNSGDPTYAKLEILAATDLPAIASEIKTGDILDAWCGNRDLPIYQDNVLNYILYKEYKEYEYQADVYSSLDVSIMPTVYKNYGNAWNVLNWLINKRDIFSEDPGTFLATHGRMNVQKLLWSIIKKAKDADLAQADLDTMLADLGVVEADMVNTFEGATFDGIRDFVPASGDMAIVLLDPYKVKIDTTGSIWWFCGWKAVSKAQEILHDDFQLMVVQVDP